MALKKRSTAYGKTAPGFEQESNDCCVRAFSIAANVGYKEVHAIAKANGREFRKGTYLPTRLAMANALGFKEQQVMGRTSYTRSGRRTTLSPTLSQWLAKHPRGRYVVSRRHHSFAVIDGVVHDWEHGTGPRSRIAEVFAKKD